MSFTQRTLSRLLATAALLAGSLFCFDTTALPASPTRRSSALIVIRISPNVDRGVTISSGDVNTNLGFVTLGSSTQTVNPATVTTTGTRINTDLDMSGSISGGWSFSNQQTLTSTGTNLLNAWAS